MATLSPQMAMTIDCDKLLSVPSGYLTPLPPTVNLQYPLKADYQEDDSQATPKQDPGELANLATATGLHEKLTRLAEKQWFEEQHQADLGMNSLDDFVKIPSPQKAPCISMPPPAPHVVPRESRKPRAAIISKGSVGHPFTCATACKYVKRKGGCRDGADCPHCHECFWSKAIAKESMERQESVASSLPEHQEELMEKVIRLLQEESMPVQVPLPSWPQDELTCTMDLMGDYGSGCVDYLGVKIPGVAVPPEPVANNPGSVGHPYNCGPACKYVLKSKGCKDGDLCTHCHICRWTRYGAKHQLKL